MLLPIWWSRSKWGDSAGRALTSALISVQVVYQGGYASMFLKLTVWDA